MAAAHPIGIFDSGIGGLTVYRALRDFLPHEDFIYLGDTLRLPYGTKTKAEIENYTVGAAGLLRARGIKFLTVACNTVSAQALDALQNAMPDLPVCGVIATGARAALQATRNGQIAVLATDGTVRSGVYPSVLRSLRPDMDVQMLACGALVTLVEAGRWTGAEAEAAVADYLARLKPGYDTLLLACTHFPMLMPVFHKYVPHSVRIIDSAATTARAVGEMLKAQGLLNPQTKPGSDIFLVTDKPRQFVQSAQQFLGRDIGDKAFLIDFPVPCLENAKDGVDCPV